MPRIASSSTCTPFCSISLPKYTTVGSSPARNAARRSALPSSGRRSLALPGFGGSSRASSISAANASSRGRERELVHVDAGRHFVDALDVADDVFEHLADVRRADVRRLRGGERLRAPAFELRPAAHRVLELGAVRLDAERRAACGADRPAHQHVVREHEIGGSSSRSVAAFASTYAAFSRVGEVLQELRLEPA